MKWLANHFWISTLLPRLRHSLSTDWRAQTQTSKNRIPEQHRSCRSFPRCTTNWKQSYIHCYSDTLWRKAAWQWTICFFFSFLPEATPCSWEKFRCTIILGWIPAWCESQQAVPLAEYLTDCSTDTMTLHASFCPQAAPQCRVTNFKLNSKEGVPVNACFCDSSNQIKET